MYIPILCQLRYWAWALSSLLDILVATGRPNQQVCTAFFAVVPKRRHDESMRDAISNRSWVHDIQGTLTIKVLFDYVHV
jgi:hypothetical protein